MPLAILLDNSQFRNLKNGHMKLLKYSVVMAIAAISTGCGDNKDNTNTKVCVDKDGKIIDDSMCEQRHGGGMMANPFMWYYGSRMLGIGQTATGGSYTPKQGVDYQTRRSGFGASSNHGSSS